MRNDFGNLQAKIAYLFFIGSNAFTSDSFINKLYSLLSIDLKQRRYSCHDSI